MFQTHLTGLLFALSVVAMLLALLAASFHGEATRKSEHFSERIFEFCRNAMIQISAMLFALAIAEFIFEKNVDRQIEEARSQSITKAKEQDKSQQLLASSIIAERATTIKRAMRRFEFRNKPGIIPDCLEEVIPTEYEVIFKAYVLDQVCLNQVNDAIKSLLDNRKSIQDEMQIIVDSFKVSEDWTKSDFFSRKMDLGILHDFESIEDRLDYRQFLIHVLIEKLEKTKHDGPAQYDEVRYISYIDAALRNFQKSSFVYLADFYLTFSDFSLTADKVRDKEKSFIASVKKSTIDEKLMSLSAFRQSLEEKLSDCYFEGGKCSQLLSRIEIDRSILTS